MIETLLGTLFGGLFRMAPEVMNHMDKKNEREHELKMLSAQNEADAARSANHLAEINATGINALNLAEVAALTEGAKVQGQLTGVKWVDGFNALMRPLLTFWWAIVLYTAALIAQFIVITNSGDVSYVNAVIKLFGVEEKALVSSMISFWFLDRTIRKNSGK